MSQIEIQAGQVSLNHAGAHGSMVIANTKPRTPDTGLKFVEIDVMTDTVFASLGGNLEFIGEEKAIGSITIDAVPANGETVTIGEVVFEFSTDGTVGEGNVEVDISVEEEAPAITIEEVANLLSTAINADETVLVVSTVNEAVVSLEAKTAGTDGNAISLTDGTTGDITLSGATLAYGTAVKTIKAGTNLRGQFTNITLTSGTVIAYQGR